MKHMRPASVVWSTLTGAEGMGHARPSWTSTLCGFSSLVLHQFMRDVWNRLITTTTTPLTSRSQLQLAGSWAMTWWNLCVSMSPSPAHCLVLNTCLNLDRFSSLYTAVCLDVRWLSLGLAQAHSCREMSHGSSQQSLLVENPPNTCLPGHFKDVHPVPAEVSCSRADS